MPSETPSRNAIIVSFTEIEYKALLSLSSLWGDTPSVYIHDMVKERMEASSFTQEEPSDAETM